MYILNAKSAGFCDLALLWFIWHNSLCMKMLGMLYCNYEYAIGNKHIVFSINT